MISGCCKNCGRTFFTFPSDINKGGGKFCSTDCFNKYRIETNGWFSGAEKMRCLSCGKEFLVAKWFVIKRGRKFCSIKCVGKYYSGKNSPFWKGGKIERKCLNCGKIFAVRKYTVAENHGKFCGRYCMGKYNSKHYSGKNSFNYREDSGPNITVICKFCHKSYKVYPSQMRRTKFCSKHCLNLHNYINAPSKDTNIEKEVSLWLNELHIKYEQQKLLLNTTFADFFLEPNIAIYCDGKYWHSKSYTKNRDKFVNKLLKDNGYKVLRLKEKEIKNQSGKIKLNNIIKINKGDKFEGTD